MPNDNAYLMQECGAVRCASNDAMNVRELDWSLLLPAEKDGGGRSLFYLFYFILFYFVFYSCFVLNILPLTIQNRRATADQRSRHMHASAER